MLFGSKKKMAEIELLESKLETTKAELETAFERLARQLETDYGVKLDHHTMKMEDELKRGLAALSAEKGIDSIESLKKIVYAKLEEYDLIANQLRDMLVKQKDYIAMAAQEAVEKAFQGDLLAIVGVEVRKLISEEGKKMLFDESNRSILGISKELTDEVIDELRDRIPPIIAAGSGVGGENNNSGDAPAMTPEEKKAHDQRVTEVLSYERHMDFPKLVGSIKAGLMPMLVGPAGTGKSTAVEQAAYELGLDFYTSNRVQMSYELTGFKDATGKFQETQFYRAYKNGGVFFLDEIDGSSPEALVTINTAMAQGYMNFPTGKVYMHKDFRLAAAGNTYGTGADAQYVGRNELDAATLDRFVVVKWDYDKKLETKIIKDPDLLKFGWNVRKAIAKLKLPIIISTRGLINFYKLMQVEGFDISERLESVLFEGIDAQSLLTIARELPNSKYKTALEKLAQKVHEEETVSGDENESD